MQSQELKNSVDFCSVVQISKVEVEGCELLFIVPLKTEEETYSFTPREKDSLRRGRWEQSLKRRSECDSNSAVELEGG